MDKNIAEKWVADLRTPGLKQAIGKLFDGEGYCCLGRLCVVMGKEFSYDIHQGYILDDDGDVLPISVKNAAGMHSDNGSIYYTDAEAENTKNIFIKQGYGGLAAANDAGVTFPEIADWIEKNYERL